MNTGFVDFPDDPGLILTWPTSNQTLSTEPDRFFARTRANPDYGKPGWTRDAGQRFHRGVDIAPVQPIATGQTTTVLFTDLATGREYPSDEATWRVEEDVFAVGDGTVREVNLDQNRSTWGLFVLLEHRWPATGASFFSVYAHLAEIRVKQEQAVSASETLGRMGQTSSSPDARNWMAIAPHLHLEFHDAMGRAYDPARLLARYVRSSRATVSM